MLVEITRLDSAALLAVETSAAPSTANLISHFLWKLFFFLLVDPICPQNAFMAYFFIQYKPLGTSTLCPFWK